MNKKKEQESPNLHSRLDPRLVHTLGRCLMTAQMIHAHVCPKLGEAMPSGEEVPYGTDITLTVPVALALEMHNLQNWLSELASLFGVGCRNIFEVYNDPRARDEGFETFAEMMRGIPWPTADTTH